MEPSASTGHGWRAAKRRTKVMMKVLSHRYDIITTAVLGQLSQTWKLAHQVHYAPSSALLSIALKCIEYEHASDLILYVTLCAYLFVPDSLALPGIHLKNLQLS